MSMKLRLQTGKRYVLDCGLVTDSLNYSAERNIYDAKVREGQGYADLFWDITGSCLNKAAKFDIVSEYTELHKLQEGFKDLTQAESLSIDDYAAEGAENKSFADQVDDVLAMVGTLLKAKNKAYGNSALDPIRVFSKADPVEQLNVRIDDKLSRIMRGTDSGEDAQAIGKLLGVPLGCAILPQIEPAIRKLIAQRDEVINEATALLSIIESDENELGTMTRLAINGMRRILATKGGES